MADRQRSPPRSPVIHDELFSGGGTCPLRLGGPLTSPEGRCSTATDTGILSYT